MHLTSVRKAKSKVLIVDDDVVLARAVSRHLVAAGFATHIARSGAEALLVYGEVDTILSDILMPDIDGLNLLRLVRGRDRDMPVIVMTASPSVGFHQAALDHGALTCLCKPIERVELVRVTEAAVRLRQLAKAKRQRLVVGERDVRVPSRRGTANRPRRSHAVKLPASEHLGVICAPDGERYSLHFYGESEGAAVVVGPIPRVYGRVVKVAEAHREHAVSADDARAKLRAWRESIGW